MTDGELKVSTAVCKSTAVNIKVSDVGAKVSNVIHKTPIGDFKVTTGEGKVTAVFHKSKAGGNISNPKTSQPIERFVI